MEKGEIHPDFENSDSLILFYFYLSAYSRICISHYSDNPLFSPAFQ